MRAPEIEEVEDAELRPAKRAKGKKAPAVRKTKIEKKPPGVVDADDEGGEVVEVSEERQGKNLERGKPPKSRAAVAARAAKKDGNDEDGDDELCFIGDPVPEEEAKARWPHRYELKV